MGDTGLGGVRRIHLVGVGGAGMSALAKLLAGRGLEVTGSDLRASESLARLADLGLEVWGGHDPARATAAEVVAASSAVPEDDPEVAAARAAGIPVWRRPQLLEAVSREIPTIGPTGTHGKTTSAAMMVVACRAAGRDPSFVVGGELLELRTNAAVGRDDLLVLEVDEAFGTFESVHLTGLVVTNVEPEHLDHFHTAEGLEESFLRVVRRVDGPVVVCADDEGAARVAAAAGRPTYGLAPGATWRIHDLALGAGSVGFRLEGPAASLRVEVPRPGMHVARNAAGVLALLTEVGMDPVAAAEGLAGFQGVRRRFEHRGTVGGVSVIDDYAHHPTEVSATLMAARGGVEGRLWAVFQPHLFSRTRAFADEFGAALALADRVVVTDVYPAREAPLPGVTGRLVAEACLRAGAGSVDYLPHLGEVSPFLARQVEAGDCVVVMGAGDVTVVPPELLSLLAQEAAP